MSASHSMTSPTRGMRAWILAEITVVPFPFLPSTASPCLSHRSGVREPFDCENVERGKSRLFSMFQLLLICQVGCEGP